jgi:hypothetical protein
VFWVHTSTRARFEEAYRVFADRLELPDRNDPNTNIFRLVYNWLCNEENGPWPIVVDNIDDAEVLFPTPAVADNHKSANDSAPLAQYLPQCTHGFLLCTSRKKDAAAQIIGGFHNIQEVTAMDAPQALQLFTKKLQDVSKEDGDAELVDVLGCITLAVTQAAAYISNRRQLTAKSFLEGF